MTAPAARTADQETPAGGHTFRFTVQSRMASKVEEEEHNTDAEDFTGEPWTVDVRGFSLREATAKLAALPLAAWHKPQPPKPADTAGTRFRVVERTPESEAEAEAVGFGLFVLGAPLFADHRGAWRRLARQERDRFIAHARFVLSYRDGTL